VPSSPVVPTAKDWAKFSNLSARRAVLISFTRAQHRVRDLVQADLVHFRQIARCSLECRDCGVGGRRGGLRCSWARTSSGLSCVSPRISELSILHHEWRFGAARSARTVLSHGGPPWAARRHQGAIH
jgi:hypothetical protein